MTGEERAAKLAHARAELAEAERLCRLLGHAVADPETPAPFAARLDVEVKVAARRLDLWRAVVAKLEAEAPPAQEASCRWAHGPVADLDARGLCPVCAGDEE